MGSYRYWGGKNDIEQQLKDRGYQVYTANVGPLSSNWDRAIELYYQIKGGEVDMEKDTLNYLVQFKNQRAKSIKDYILNGIKTIQCIWLATV